MRPLYIHAILRDIATRPPVKGTGGFFVRKKNLMLQTTIVIDYQNMHNVAFKTWGEYLGYANIEQSLLHPYRLGQAIVDKRNSLMQEGYEPASLNRVLVYRERLQLLVSEVGFGGPLLLGERHADKRIRVNESIPHGIPVDGVEDLVGIAFR